MQKHLGLLWGPPLSLHPSQLLSPTPAGLDNSLYLPPSCAVVFEMCCTHSPKKPAGARMWSLTFHAGHPAATRFGVGAPHNAQNVWNQQGHSCFVFFCCSFIISVWDSCCHSWHVLKPRIQELIFLIVFNAWHSFILISSFCVTSIISLTALRELSVSWCHSLSNSYYLTVTVFFMPAEMTHPPISLIKKHHPKENTT